MNGIERPMYMAQKFFKNSMTNVSFISILIAGLIAAAALVVNEAQAQETEDVLPPEEIAAQYAAEQDAARTQLRQQSQLSEQKQERILNLVANINNKLAASGNRLADISFRLQMRIEKMVAEGVDVSTEQAELTELLPEIITVQNNITTIYNDAYRTIASENPSATWADVRTVIENSRATLETSHATLTDITERLIQKTTATPEAE